MDGARNFCSQKRIRKDSDDEGLQQPEAVLEEKYTQGVTLVDAYASVILNKRETANLVKELSHELPLRNLLHLKRVRSLKGKDSSLQILVCSKSESSDEILASLQSCFPSLGKPVLVQVSEHAPQTRSQYQDASKYWPVTFHEDKRIACLLSGRYFHKSELQKIHSHMMSTLQLAHSAAENSQECIGAVIVDPDTDLVLAQSHDMRRGDNQLQHAVMVAIDLVARSQGGGMWALTGREDPGLLYRRQECCMPGEMGRSKVGPYLCTGYDLYVNIEPCIMCAMALVHSRISRVFYACPHPEGALGSRYKIHVQSGLNHHFQVFRGVCTDKCLQTGLNVLQVHPQQSS